jgi:hypothetical protein
MLDICVSTEIDSFSGSGSGNGGASGSGSGYITEDSRKGIVDIDDERPVVTNIDKPKSGGRKPNIKPVVTQRPPEVTRKPPSGAATALHTTSLWMLCVLACGTLVRWWLAF